MCNYIYMKDKDLALLLEEWFLKHKYHQRKWSMTHVGKLIKNTLKKQSHWKENPRGKQFGHS